MITQFLTSDHTENGDLILIKRIYEQDGKRIDGGVITDMAITKLKKDFIDKDVFTKHGGLKALGKAIQNQFVLVMTLWGDSSSDNMQWLDSILDSDIKNPRKGSKRGPCSASRTFQDTLRDNQASFVSYTNILVDDLRH